MKKDAEIDYIARFQRLRDSQTNQPTNGRSDMTSHKCAKTQMKGFITFDLNA